MIQKLINNKRRAEGREDLVCATKLFRPQPQIMKRNSSLNKLRNSPIDAYDLACSTILIDILQENKEERLIREHLGVR